MFDILLFAGTSEGRALAEYLRTKRVSTCVFAATEYGGSLVQPSETLQVRSGRLDAEQMQELFEAHPGTIVIDATHPYAMIASENIKKASEAASLQYVRVLRVCGNENHQHMIYVDSVKEAAAFLNTTQGNVLVTTGSKELKEFQAVENYQERIYARVLSLGKVVSACEELGFCGKHLLCMQGPFSTEMNAAMLRQYDIKYLVTKDTGVTGGFPEKVEAANSCGCQVVVIAKPAQSEGLSVEECIAYLREKYKLQDTTIRRNISIVGIGMSGEDSMSVKGRRLCKAADLIIGARRIADAVCAAEQDCFYEYRAEEIKAYILAHEEYKNIAIVMSGDTGFFSGTKKLLGTLAKAGMQAEVVPGISSLSYFAGKIGQSWEDADICSVHGRDCNLIGHVLKHKKVFSILGKTDDVAMICQKLDDYGFEDIRIYVGESLGYPDERIRGGSIHDFVHGENDPLSVIMILNPNADDMAGSRIPDDRFERDKVPMTKEEVRTISVAKMNIRKDAILYDVGAGSGSVSIEMARAAMDGKVYAIEKKDTALALLEKNRRKFAADNMVIVPGDAAEVMKELPTPDAVFIGGSGRNMPEIIRQLVEKNPKVRIVINAITIETIAEAIQVLKDNGLTHPEIVSVNIAKSKEISDYHLMMAQNPVYIISAEATVD